jgi:hypothetical protein
MQEQQERQEINERQGAKGNLGKRQETRGLKTKEAKQAR